MSKFDEFFKDVQKFTNNDHVISGKYTKAEAAEKMSYYLGVDVAPGDLIQERVRFGFAPEFIEECAGELCWYSGATGKGSLPVWVLNGI